MSRARHTSDPEAVIRSVVRGDRLWTDLCFINPTVSVEIDEQGDLSASWDPFPVSAVVSLDDLLSGFRTLRHAPEQFRYWAFLLLGSEFWSLDATVRSSVHTIVMEGLFDVTVGRDLSPALKVLLRQPDDTSWFVIA